MDEPTPDQPNDLEAEPTFDPTRRKLCPDGTCVGVIGDDGRCRVCGRTEAAAEAGEPATGVGASEALDADEPAASASVEGDEAGGFDSRRRLCDDGTCVGVLGDDGVCRVCGRRSE